jgi:hypothetical protein
MRTAAALCDWVSGRRRWSVSGPVRVELDGSVASPFDDAQYQRCTQTLDVHPQPFGHRRDHRPVTGVIVAMERRLNQSADRTVY